MPDEENVIVACPYCGMQFEIPTEYLGETAECSGCTNRFVLTLPAESESQGEQAQPAAAPPPSAAQTVVVPCSHCGAQFEVPSEYLGETAECSECGASFILALPPEQTQMEVPQQQFVPPPLDIPVQDSGVTVTKAEMDEATNTVKLSRKKIGMLPDVKDDPFNVQVIPSVRSTQTDIDIPKESIASRMEPKAVAEAATPQEPPKKWWQFWKWFKK